MKKWEYSTVTTDQGYSDPITLTSLNEMGQEGWEIIAVWGVIPTSDAHNNNYREYIVKRRKKTPLKLLERLRKAWKNKKPYQSKG